MLHCGVHSDTLYHGMALHAIPFRTLPCHTIPHDTRPYGAILCYAMLCCAMPSYHAMLSYAMLHYAMLSYAPPYLPSYEGKPSQSLCVHSVPSRTSSASTASFASGSGSTSSCEASATKTPAEVWGGSTYVRLILARCRVGPNLDFVRILKLGLNVLLCWPILLTTPPSRLHHGSCDKRCGAWI